MAAGNAPLSPLPGASGGCEICRTELRGITLRQLRALFEYVKKHCVQEGWYDKRTQELLTPDRVNLYHLCHWALKPLTQERQCSYVELVAESPEAQRPLWFVSHWWGEPLCAFIACLEEHARCRHLGDDAPYWVCAYANNQWRLDEEIASDPAESAFRKAMDVSEGTVQVIDENAVCFSRLWCRYEGFVSLTIGSKPYDLVAKRDPVGLYVWSYDLGGDGYFVRPMSEKVETGDLGGGEYVGLERTWEATVILDPQHKRAKRMSGYWANVSGSELKESEHHFPTHVANMAMASTVEAAQASVKDDRSAILNSIVRFVQPAWDLHAEPPAQHEAYFQLNALLRARFAIAAWTVGSKDRAAWGYDEFPRFVRESSIKEWSVDATKTSPGNDKNLHDIAEALPAMLATFEVCLDNMKCTNEGIQAIAERLPTSLVNLSLSMVGCDGVDEVSVCSLGKNMPHQLTHLVVIFSHGKVGEGDQNCYEEFWKTNQKVSDASMEYLAKGLPQSLETLVFDMRGWSMITDLGFQAFVEHLPEKLQKLQICLSACESMTIVALEMLAKRLPALDKLRELTLDLRDFPTELAEGDAGAEVMRMAWAPRDPAGLKMQ